MYGVDQKDYQTVARGINHRGLEGRRLPAKKCNYHGQKEDAVPANDANPVNQSNMNESKNMSRWTFTQCRVLYFTAVTSKTTGRYSACNVGCTVPYRKLLHVIWNVQEKCTPAFMCLHAMKHEHGAMPCTKPCPTRWNRNTQCIVTH